jgi:uridylate kinase
MQKKIFVLSLGGSLIIPNEINLEYLKKFKKIILKNLKNYKFVIVCGGGSIARKYIYALRKMGLNHMFQGFAGISATRMNARFMSYFFKHDQEKGIPHKLSELKEDISKSNIIFCGSLEYSPKQTSDSTAAQIAGFLKCSFANLTNVNGLYNKNPKEHKDAKLIKEISWNEFEKMANKLKYEPGQHFVLDQTASKIIKKNKTTTYILGNNINQLDNLLNGKKFIGTKISG